ncbi:ABC transporter ATP-binding protein [Devriesea agamarum]|uniref:ABC transporter ATP-binding protein n=1 Tax=Devriesea agamarum TaxID=472569 RepID=UPI00071D8D7A|nr:ATP-binding cassette domain-containing protein [Devriesea agamarum]
MKSASSRPSGRPQTAPLVQADGVEVTRDKTVLLPPTDLTLKAGDSLALTGVNGSGKTTLLRVITGLTKPSSGTIQIGGRAPNDRDPEFRKTVAGLVGPPPIARDLTILEHLIMIGTTWGHTIPEAREAAREVLDLLEIRDLEHRFPHELSSGQSQLTTLALVLSRPSDLLVLDEPEQRLDPGRLETVGQVLRARVEAGTALLIATHSVSLRDAVANSVHDLSRNAQ